MMASDDEFGHSLRYMMSKLDEREKKLAEEKLYKDDSNRKFVIEEAHTFLRELPEVAPILNQ